MNPSSPPPPPVREASAVKGAIVLTPIAAMTRIVANEKTFAASMVLFLFLFLRCFFISVPSTNAMDKRIPLIEKSEAKIKN
jgi:hypothetical protein